MLLGDCGIFVVKYAEYIFLKKINEMPNDFDTGVARHNMSVQLFKFSVEKPDLRLPGISKIAATSHNRAMSLLLGLLTQARIPDSAPSSSSAKSMGKMFIPSSS
ncbi:Uncharacterized protein Fot_11609 [Forsythia ovata]|uniref:Ubiquitin-like protease family profile domain-containing protein n=1 Tax=Forsythia ovata TaxID=205694 RepID=A0ABD1WK62_9LAMI